MNNGNAILVVIILVGVLFLLWFLARKFKVLNLPCVFFVSGAVKSGKSLLAVHLAIKEYKKNLRWYYIKKYFVKIFLPFKYKDTYGLYDEYVKKEYCDIDIAPIYKEYCPPMLYSNIPLAYIKFNMLTIDIIESLHRIPRKSVCLIDEVSLFADSMLFKDVNLNNKLTRFVKLYGHSTHGGKLVIDSQSFKDNHFSFKRCMDRYLYIYDRKKLPFVSVLRVREMMSIDDGQVVNSVNEDIELSLRKVLIWNTTYNKYDCYCYSVFTDYLPLEVCYTKEKLTKKDDLKCYYIVSLNEFVQEMNKEIIGKYPSIEEDVGNETCEK